jgi:folate-dependent tRNA-U54 methylase TrmFO/GidA
MNANFGLLPPLPTPARGKAKKELMAKRALKDIELWKAGLGQTPVFELVKEA